MFSLMARITGDPPVPCDVLPVVADVPILNHVDQNSWKWLEVAESGWKLLSTHF